MARSTRKTEAAQVAPRSAKLPKPVADAAPRAPAANAGDPSKSSDVVMIGCKLPHGYTLEIIKVGNLLQPSPKGKRYVLKGANSLRTDRRAAQGEFPYAVTPVPRDFWEAWLKHNENHTLEPVVKGFIFAARDADRARAEGKERQGEKTGLEAIDLEGDARTKSIGRVNGNPVTADEEAGALRGNAA